MEQLIQELQNIYVAQLSRSQIDDKSIDVINAFQVVRYKEFEILEKDLESLKDVILRYREGRAKSLTTTATSISMEEVQAQKAIENSIKVIMEKI